MNTPTPELRCRACHHFEASKLAGYGYCRNAPSLMARARFLPEETVCLFSTQWQQGAR